MLKDRIRELRQARGWNQTDLAARAGLRQGTIANLETGARDNPTRETLDKLARAFGIAVSELVSEDDILASPAPPVPTWRAWGVDEAQIARAAAVWGALSRDQRARVHGSFDVSTRALHAVDSLIEQVQVRIDTLRAQVQEADDPPATDEPIRPQDAVEVQSNKHSLRHKALSLG